MTDKLITVEEFQPKNIIYKDPKKNSHGGVTIPYLYNCPRRGEIPFLLKTPKCSLPFGASQYPSKENVIAGKEHEVRYSMELSFTGYSGGDISDPKMKMFFDKMTAFQKERNAFLFKNSKKFLKKTYKSIDVLEELCNPIIKYSRDKQTGEISDKYAPRISTKLGRDRKDDKNLDTFSGVRVYRSTDKSKRVEFDISGLQGLFPSRSSVKGLISGTSVSVVSGKVSTPLYAKQLMVFPSEHEIVVNVFADDSDNEDEDAVAVCVDSDDEDAVADKKVPVAKPTKSKPAPAPESDDDEDEDSEVEVEVEVTDDDED